MNELEAGARNARFRGTQSSIHISSFDINKSLPVREEYFCQDINIFLGLDAVCNENNCEFFKNCKVPGKRMEEVESA